MVKTPDKQLMKNIRNCYNSVRKVKNKKWKEQMALAATFQKQAFILGQGRFLASR